MTQQMLNTGFSFKFSLSLLSLMMLFSFSNIKAQVPNYVDSINQSMAPAKGGRVKVTQGVVKFSRVVLVA